MLVLRTLAFSTTYTRTPPYRKKSRRAHGQPYRQRSAADARMRRARWYLADIKTIIASTAKTRETRCSIWLCFGASPAASHWSSPGALMAKHFNIAEDTEILGRHAQASRSMRRHEATEKMKDRHSNGITAQARGGQVRLLTLH